MLTILDRDRTDEEALGYALDTLANICSPEEFEEEIIESRLARPGTTQRSASTEKQYGCIGEQFTEIFLKQSAHVQLVLGKTQNSTIFDEIRQFSTKFGNFV